MYNRKRREKLADLLFDLVKFILTVGVVGGIFTDTIKFPYLIVGVCCTFVLVSIAYFLTPKDKED